MSTDDSETQPETRVKTFLTAQLAMVFLSLLAVFYLLLKFFRCSSS